MGPPDRMSPSTSPVFPWRSLINGVEVQRCEDVGYTIRSPDGHPPALSEVADAAEQTVWHLDAELKIWENVGWVLRSEGTDPEPYIRAATEERDFFRDLLAWAGARSGEVRRGS